MDNTKLGLDMIELEVPYHCKYVGPSCSCYHRKSRTKKSKIPVYTTGNHFFYWGGYIVCLLHQNRNHRKQEFFGIKLGFSLLKSYTICSWHRPLRSMRTSKTYNLNTHNDISIACWQQKSGFVQNVWKLQIVCQTSVKVSHSIQKRVNCNCIPWSMIIIPLQWSSTSWTTT